MSLLIGIVVETDVRSWTGKYLYSDWATGKAKKNTTLNSIVKVPVIGIVGGIARVALGIIHSLGHLFLALVTWKKGHLYHAAKGGCEILRGLIEATPIIGRIFANLYNSVPSYDPAFYDPYRNGGRSWWMIKIYNPSKPDGLDQWMDNWQGWSKSQMVYA